ncbi:MAG: winged helix-turn-helix transcriptional regulator [Fusobacteriaceae bacterium]
MVEYKDKQFVCLLDLGVEFIRGKWKAVIMCHLKGEPVRFLELQRKTKGVTQKMLNEQLKSLEDDGLVIRKVYPEVPPRVEYSLSEKGRDLVEVLDGLESWAQKYFSE